MEYGSVTQRNNLLLDMTAGLIDSSENGAKSNQLVLKVTRFHGEQSKKERGKNPEEAAVTLPLAQSSGMSRWSPVADSGRVCCLMGAWSCP